MSEINKYSKTLTQDPTQPASQAMLYGVGLTDDDMNPFKGGTIVLQNNSDGKGDFIAEWNHPSLSKPTQSQLDSA